MAKAPKMVNLAIEETSGVDHPAHLHEGWLVVKAADRGEIDRIVKSLTDTPEEEPVSEDTTVETEVIVEPDTELPETVEVPDTVEALIAELAEARATILALRSDEATAEDDAFALVKSAPEAVRKAFDAMREQATLALEKAAQVEATLIAERETRADEAAVIKARETFSNLSVDPSVLGPALRKVAAGDPALAETITAALTAANAQAESGAIFAEIGKSASHSTGSAYERLESIAKAAMDKGDSPTFAQAFSSAVTANPDLYIQHMSEKGA